MATGARCSARPSLPGAVLARVASSHLRVGSFQYARATDDTDLLRRLADHAIARHHPERGRARTTRTLALFDAVVAAQASLVAQWMLVGFIHGVMNTDNMTISGETIDYGPCAFMDAYDPATVYSSIDTGGRYAYGNQPVVAEWNLARLAEALLPLLHDEQDAGDRAGRRVARRASAAQYDAAWAAGMRAKLGLPEGLDDVRGHGAGRRAARRCCGESHVDHTSFFRRLGAAARGDAEPVRGLFLDLAAVRRLARALARPGPGRRRRWTGSTPSTSRATTSSRRRSSRRDRRRPGAARPAARGRDRAVRRAPRPGALRRARARRTSAAYRTFCGT